MNATAVRSVGSAPSFGSFCTKSVIQRADAQASSSRRPSTRIAARPSRTASARWARRPRPARGTRSARRAGGAGRKGDREGHPTRLELGAGRRLLRPDPPDLDVSLEVALAANRRPGHAAQHGELTGVPQRVGDRTLEQAPRKEPEPLVRREEVVEAAGGDEPATSRPTGAGANPARRGVPARGAAPSRAGRPCAPGPRPACGSRARHGSRRRSAARRAGSWPRGRRASRGCDAAGCGRRPCRQGARPICFM
jgi:hypothetical protein